MCVRVCVCVHAAERAKCNETLEAEAPLVAVVTSAVVVGAIGVIATIIIVAVLCICQRKKSKVLRTHQGGGHGREENVVGSHNAPLPWTLHQLVGQGRFGRVYSATCDNQLVAVKIYSQLRYVCVC